MKTKAGKAVCSGAHRPETECHFFDDEEELWQCERCGLYFCNREGGPDDYLCDECWIKLYCPNERLEKVKNVRMLTKREKKIFPGDNYVDVALRAQNGTEYYGESDDTGEGNHQYVNNEDGEHIPVKK